MLGIYTESIKQTNYVVQQVDILARRQELFLPTVKRRKLLWSCRQDAAEQWIVVADW